MSLTEPETESENGARPLSVPDRFESLSRRTNPAEIDTIVVPVESALEEVDRRFSQMKGSSRGCLVVLRGESGAGKSTFLHTMGRFRKGVKTTSIPAKTDIRAYFGDAIAQAPLEVFVLEEREAAVNFTDQELEEWLHAINGFIRTERGEHALVVWPCNTDELTNRIVALAERVGGEALLGTGNKILRFKGPSKSQFRQIAENTIAVLNQGATFSDLGLSDKQTEELVEKSNTIGGFLASLRDEIQKQERYVEKLLEEEKARLWIIVIAGSEPNQEVAALTRGQYSAVDIERLLTSTEANIVQELKSKPEQLGILATTLDAKILHLPVLSALALVRAFSGTPLKERMKAANLKLTPDKKSDAIARLKSTELARIFTAQSQGTLTTGKKLGSLSVEAFSKLAELASTNDRQLNVALAEGFRAAGLISEFSSEQDFGTGLSRRTDIVAEALDGTIRIEIMWRRRTGRADIANYVLTKLSNYGRALSYF